MRDAEGWKIALQKDNQEPTEKGTVTSPVGLKHWCSTWSNGDTLESSPLDPFTVDSSTFLEPK